MSRISTTSLKVISERDLSAILLCGGCLCKKKCIYTEQVCVCVCVCVNTMASAARFGQSSFIVNTDILQGLPHIVSEEARKQTVFKAFEQLATDATWFAESLELAKRLQTHLLAEALTVTSQLTTDESNAAEDAPMRRDILQYVFQEQMLYLDAQIKSHGNTPVKSSAGGGAQQQQQQQWGSAATAPSDEDWPAKRRLFDAQMEQMQQVYSAARPLVRVEEWRVAAHFKMLRSELEHFDFVQTPVQKNIDAYLDAVFMQYQLENTFLTDTESRQLSEKLLHYQLSREDAMRHDPMYQYLHLVAGLLSFTNIDRLVEDDPFASQSFHVGDDKHGKIADAVAEFLQSIEDDDDEAEVTQAELKTHFKRQFTSLLMSDAESSGRYVLLPAVATHRDQSYLQILNKFGHDEESLPMMRLLEDKQLRTYFAEITVSNFISSNLLQPKRWSPAESFRRSLTMKKKAFFMLGKRLGSTTHKRQRTLQTQDFF